jgi:hypothetical protein
MFLGDGFSIPTLAAARAYLGQSQGATGEETVLSFEEFPNTGLSKVSDIKSTTVSLMKLDNCTLDLLCISLFVWRERPRKKRIA